MKSIRRNTQPADKAARILDAKSHAKAAQTALREVLALRRFKKLMKKHAGKLEFGGHGK